ncbi:CAP domain-containing protein [Alteribacter keqinensis]|uniref:LysM peptidoglycan-binding domain-containing protein n=1 Tax=Alteribacter keqinensis TaxID=2483800 RepID=A0A3M7TSM0_9BACI|nr:CAP domain-containing protein [Alteribacter keqinensis]RNA68630.1 LysM peptidoglycan-binding domain-containing protein [Alteribacter keqinensis]
MLKKLIYSVLAVAVAVPLVVGNTAEASSTHTVESGDTLYKISQQYDVSLSDIIDANSDIDNPDMIYPGQQVTLPSAQSAQQPSQTSEQTSSELSEFEQEVVRLTNEERAQHGLPELEIAEDVSEVARDKSADMRDNNYFDHNSPTHGSPFDMMRSYGVNYNAAGENIAAGQQTPEQVVDAWMNSQGHRENILSSNYTEIGVGHVEGGQYGHYWTQMFISR